MLSHCACICMHMHVHPILAVHASLSCLVLTVNCHVPAHCSRRWFHGSITRHTAEARLSQYAVGTYLFRESETRPGFSLSLRVPDKVCVCVCVRCVCLNIYCDIVSAAATLYQQVRMTLVQ